MAQKKAPPLWVYVATDGTACKIGVAFSPERRVATLQVGNPRRIRLCAMWRTKHPDIAFCVEQIALRACGRHSCSGEWVSAPPVAVQRLVDWVTRNLGKTQVRNPAGMREVQLAMLLERILAMSGNLIVERFLA